MPPRRPSAIPPRSSHAYGHDPMRYPIKAVYYTLRRRSLWWRVFRVACAGCAVVLIALVLLLALALRPQAEWISSIGHDHNDGTEGGQQAAIRWWAWLLATLLVLFEAAAFAALTLAVSQSKAQTELFAATMREEGMWREGMVVQSVIKDLNLIRKAFLVRVITYPIQVVPLLGGAVYSAINATFTGWDYMDRYFDAICLPTRLQRVEVFGADHSDCSALLRPSTYDADNGYARFGFMVGFLESAPLVGSVVFPLTNAVAAALFACDIERAGGLACLRDDGGDDHPPVRTTEDPKRKANA